jgi:uncharacterized lipoprotein YddW (UPF0748 family)
MNESSSGSFSRRKALQLFSTATVAGMMPEASVAEKLPCAVEQKMSPIARAPRPTKEVRAIWIHPEQHISAGEAEGKQQIKAMVERFARANFNLLLPWTVSGYLAALDHEEYRKDHPTAAWDYLGVLVEEATKLGLDVDMWYSFTDYRDPKSPEFNPAIGGSPEWMAKRLDEVEPNQTGMKLENGRVDNVCPQHYQARVWMQAQLDRTFARYPKLHGFHIEEPGYGTRGYCVCKLCQSVYEQLHGQKLTEVLDTATAEDFRTLGMSAFIEEVRQQMAERHPKLQLSANGGYDWRHDRIRGRDWGRWANSGWLRYFVPQVYVSNVPEFREQLALTLDDIGRSCPVYAGMALDSTSGKTTIEQIVLQIEAARDLGAPGVALFHGAAFSDEQLKVLKDGPFKRPA